MKRFAAAVLVLALVACAEPLSDRFPPEPGAAGNHVIWVVSHGWHTGIVIDRAEAGALGALGGAFPEARYLEIGWGDIGFYTAPADGITAGLTLEALFASRGSVLHVVALDAMPERAFPAAEVERLVVSDAGFRAMIARIDAAFARDGGGAAAPLRTGIYGDSRFYPARGRYWALNTCNNWTAAVLRETGCPITVAYALTAGNVMFQVRRYCGAPMRS